MVYRSEETAASAAAPAGAAARRPTPLAASEIGRTAADATRFDDPTADPGATYRYAVAAPGASAGTPAEAPGDPTTATQVELCVDLATTGSEAALNDAALQRYLADRPAISVTPVDVPALTDERYDDDRTRFTGGSFDLDLVRLDIVRTGAFGGDLADLGPLGAADVASDHVGNADFWGYVWQGTSYEGLTCNALEWLASAGGGTIVSADGVVTVDNPDAIAIVDQAAGWVGTIGPADVTVNAEESDRSVFQDADAALMHNWPYAYAQAQADGNPAAGLVGVAPFPAGDGGSWAGTPGGWHLGVPDASPNPVAAVDLALFLTSEAEHAERLAEGFWPTRPAVYDDPYVLAGLPIADVVAEAVSGAVMRPSAPTSADYPDVSQAFLPEHHDGPCTAQRREIRYEAPSHPHRRVGRAVGLDRLRSDRWWRRLARDRHLGRVAVERSEVGGMMRRLVATPSWGWGLRSR